jgi:mannitol-1-phosphate 5-dehydrogenase
VIFTAVGGKNLPAIVPALAGALKSAAPRTANVITCENWKLPADMLKNGVFHIAPEIKAGFSEAVVMRSAIEPPSGDPLDVFVQDYWRLPVDADRLAAPLPDILGVEPIHDFAGYLERKFYTYNAANGTVSYLGALLGHEYISDAAADGRIAEILDKVYDETSRALCAKYGIPFEQQAAFAETSRSKLLDRVIVDTTERNARDPIRKLGPEDRLVGSAKLALDYGIMPEGIAAAAAAAIYYNGGPNDPSSKELRMLREAEGPEGVLQKVCGLSAGDLLYGMIQNKIEELRDKKWI